MNLIIGQIYRVATDLGKVWKVLEFKVEIFKDLRSLENDYKNGKSRKILANCDADLGNTDVPYIM